MSADRLTMEQIFGVVKVRFCYASDQTTFGKPDYWATYKELTDRVDAGHARDKAIHGDCDDAAEIFVHMLRENGYEARFILCLTESGEGHLVSSVDGWIFDNRYSQIMKRDDMPYTWLLASGLLPGEPWHIIVSP